MKIQVIRHRGRRKRSGPGQAAPEQLGLVGGKSSGSGLVQNRVSSVQVSHQVDKKQKGRAKGFVRTLLGLVPGFCLGGLMTYIVYRIVWVSLLGACLGACLGAKKLAQWQKKRERQALLLAFREVLDYLSASYAAGRNTKDSFTSAWREASFQYGPKAVMTQALEELVLGLGAGDSIEKCLTRLAQALPLVEIQDFSRTFLTVYHQGGNLKQLVETSKQIISRQIDVNLEIQTIIFEQERQVWILSLMPYALITMIDAFGLTTVASDNPLLLLVRTLAAFCFLLGYLWAKAIVGRLFKG